MKKKFYLLSILLIFQLAFFQAFSLHLNDNLNNDSLSVEPSFKLENYKFLKKKKMFAFNKTKMQNFLLQKESLYQNAEIKVSTVYPNPASAYALIDYNLQKKVDAKIIITNAIGTKVDEFRLNTSSKSLRLPTNRYASGVYFYTLSIGGKSKASKKLFVKH